MEMKDIKKGDVLFWNDPDDGICSCKVTVKKIYEDSIVCEEESGGEVRAYPNELERI